MVKGVVEQLPELPNEVFISARQENLETIHQHNVIAERFGTLGEIRCELETGEHSDRHTSRRAWLDATV
jgi:GTP cyclohydrolase IV